MKHKIVEDSSYDNIKKWGDEYSEGDIIQVTSDYLDSHDTTAVEGDFYIALGNYQSGADYPELPGWGENNQYFKHAWTALSSLKLVLDNGEASGALYGNGLNKLAVLAVYTPIDDTGVVVPLPTTVRQSMQLTLIDYTTGERLPDGWTTTSVADEFYSSPVGPQPVRFQHADDGDFIETLYISCGRNEPHRRLAIGVQLTLPNGNVITSSAMSDTQLHSKIDLTALDPITYNSDIISVTSLSQEIPGVGSYKNYYLFPKDDRFRFIRSNKISGLRDENKQEGLVSFKFYYADGVHNEMGFRFIYYWNVTPEPETRTSLGIYREITAPINARPGAVNFTRTTQIRTLKANNQQDSRECIFEVFDQYGNSGRFKNSKSTGLWQQDRDGTDPYWYDIQFVDA